MIKNEQLDFIKINCPKLPKEEISIIYNKVRDYMLLNGNILKNEALLVVINNILIKTNLQKIEKLEDCVLIKKNIIFNEHTNTIIEENINILFGPFCKTKYKFYMRTNYKSYFYSFLKNACIELGYELICSKTKNEKYISIKKNDINL